VVFLDNGRLALAADPVFSEALRCVRCGACANVCPIYTSVGGHNYGHVYIGAIGLILTLFYHGEENARTIVNNCLNCLACKSVCPAEIDLPHLIKKATGEVHRRIGKKPGKNRALAAIMKNRRLFHFLLRKAYLAQKPYSDADGLIRHPPFVFTAEHRFRSIPRLAKTPLRDQFAARVTHISTPKYRVALFGGCAVDFIYPEQGKAFLDLMGRFSVQVEYPLSQTCCGLPLLMAAEEPVAREVARQNLSAFSPDRYDFIVTLCASCASHLKENYPKLLAGEKAPETLPMFTEKVIDFSSFIADHLASESAAFRGRGRKVAYHAPCHLCRGLGVTRAPKTLLHAAGLEYTAYPDEDVCCGFAGSYSVDFPEVSAEILGRKLDRVAAAGAGELVTDCPGCVLQLRGGADKRGLPIRVRHIAECLLEELL
jgi:Fe-S oxidoreductase